MTSARPTIPYKFHARSYQEHALTAMDMGYKRAVWVWHRRCGKDKTALNFTIKCMAPHPQNPTARVGVYYHIFPTYAQGKSVIWDNIDRQGMKFLDHFPKEMIKKKHEKDMTIETTTGSIWKIVGTDKDVDKLVGPNPVGCVFSEYSLQNPMAWKLIQPILEENGGWAIFIYTPRGKNHAYDLFKMAEDNPYWYSRLLTIHDTRRDGYNIQEKKFGEGEDNKPIFTLDDIKRIQEEETEEDLTDQEYLCSWEGYRQGSYYGKHIKFLRDNGRIVDGIYDPNLPVNTAWDLGHSDSTVIWFYQRKFNEPRIINHYKESGESFPHYAGVLREYAQKYGYSYRSHYAPHDVNATHLAMGTSVWEVARNFGINFIDITKPNDIMDVINAVRSVLKTFWFEKKLTKDGLNALDNYHKQWDDKREMYRNKPVHDWSADDSDAMGVLAQALLLEGEVGFRRHKKRKRKSMSDYNVFSRT